MDFLIRGSEQLAKFEGFRLVGRDVELRRFISVLMRGRSSSVILVGAGGVGCTALCLGIQEAKQQPDAPFDLVNKRLFWLDTNSLFASGNSEEVVNAFHRIINRLKQTTEPVLLIDDTRDFIEACRNNGLSHFLNALLVLVRSRKCQIIFEAKEEDLDLVLKCHSDVRELFTLLPLEEPTGEALLSIVRSSAVSLSKFHGIRVADDAVTTAIELTSKYRARDGLNRAQPERSVTLLDRSLATYRLTIHAAPPGFTNDEWHDRRKVLDRLYHEQREAEQAIAGWQASLDEIAQRETRTEFQSPESEKLRANIRVVQEQTKTSKTEFSKLTAEINDKLELTRDLVLGEFSDISGIPASKLSQNELEKLRSLETALSTRIFGQEEAVRRLVDGVKTARIGRRSGKPLAYLFLGPSGVGKTEVGKALSWAQFDDEAALVRFDMSEYMEKHAVAKMIGAPPGYELAEAGGILTNLMLKNSYRILLFDEIEKGHPDIFNIFLQVLGDGRLTDNLGRTVSFADAIIIMTTNIGQTHFLDESVPIGTANAAAIVELNETYRSEFLNRFAGRQNIICFKKLELDSIRKIARREISGIDQVYRERGVSVNVDEKTLNDLCQDQYDPKVGARGLPGFISANLEPIIVNSILDNRSGDAQISYDCATHKFGVTWKTI